MRPTLCFIIIIFLLSSCSGNTNDERTLLELSEKVLDNNPDSALALLDKIVLVDQLPDELRVKYYLLKVSAKDKCNRDISSDSTVFYARDFYSKKNGRLNSASAYFYSGRVYQSNKDYKSAMYQYLESERHISSINSISENDNLKGLIQSYIGDLFYEDLHPEKAIPRFHKAADYFKKADKTKNEVTAYNRIGISYLMMETKKDSATHYLQKAFDMANTMNEPSLLSYMYHNLGLAWAEIDNLKQATVNFQSAIRCTSDTLLKTKTYASMSRVYFYYNLPDSSVYYINRAKSLLGDRSSYDFKKYLVKLETEVLKSEGKYDRALILQEEYIAFIENEYNTSIDQSILKIQEKYNYELIRNEHNEVLIKNQRLFIALLITIIIVLILGVIIGIISYNNKKVLNEAEERILAFNDLVDQSNKKDDSLKDILFDHFSILKKAALLEGYLKKEEKESGQKLLKKFNEIVYGTDRLNWDALYDAMNKLYNKALDKFNKRFNDLDDIEFKVCCMIYADFSNTEISIILGLSNRSITAKRSSIRKKIGLDDYGNIGEYLKSTIKK